MRIAIYGCGDWATKILPFCEKNKIKIEFFLQTEKKIDTFYGFPVKAVCEFDFAEIDWIVISSNRFYDEMLSELKKLSSYNETAAHKIKSFGTFLDMFFDENAAYRTATVKGGLHYIFSKTDTVLGPMMAYSGVNHGAKIMEDIFAFARANSKFNDSGYFFDIGANIGTASIYAKYLHPQLKVVAFEPGNENYKLLRTNCILNGMDDIRIENIALGKEPGSVNYAYTPDNPGGSHLVTGYECGEKVKITSLDCFCNENNIKPSDISFIWMDTEGFEDECVIGMKNIIQMTGGVPFLQEFNPSYYIKKGNLDTYINILKGVYQYFIDARQDTNKIQKIPIDRLNQFANECKKQTDLFFL